MRKILSTTYKIETNGGTNDCYIVFFLGEDEVHLNMIHCSQIGKGTGRQMLIDLLNFLTTSLICTTDNKCKMYNDKTQVFLTAVANEQHKRVWEVVPPNDPRLSDFHANFPVNISMVNEQRSLAINYKSWGLKIPDKPHDPGHYDLYQPMTSTIGEIKRAMYENHKILGGKTKSKRNKSRRRRVLRKSRRQIKKRN